MKSLNKIRDELENKGFDLRHESDMVQSRILSPIIEAMEKEGLTQDELSKKTGLKQPFISAILNVRKKLNMEHIALFQEALGIVIQTPEALSINEHKYKFYNKDEYESPAYELFEETYHDSSIKTLRQYSKSKRDVTYSSRKLSTFGFTERLNEPTPEYKSGVLAI